MADGAQARQRRRLSTNSSLGAGAGVPPVQIHTLGTTRPPAATQDGDSDNDDGQYQDDDIDKSWFNAEGRAERINNPFAGWDEHDVVRAARTLARHYGVPDSSETFVKAAQALYDPTPTSWNKTTIPGLTAHENQVLVDEKMTSFWDQPWPLHTTFFVLFVAAIVQGWNQTATTGANLGWPHDLLFEGGENFNVNTDLNANCIPNGPSQKWIFAAINAMPYLAASAGTLFADALNEIFFGRRNAILLSALFIFASAVSSAYVQDWQSLLGLRAVLGVGMGCKAAVVPVFAAELAPAHLRGTLVMNWQVFDALGIFLGYTSNLIVASTASPWRWQLATSCIPTFALIWGSLYVRWDSPRFLMKQEEHNRRRHELVKKIWNEQQKTTNISDHTSTVHHRFLVLPDWLYIRVPKPLLNVSRPLNMRAYRSPAYETLLLLRGEPILAAKELIFAHCQLMTEIYSYPTAKRQSVTEMHITNADPSQHHPEERMDANSVTSLPRVRPEQRANFKLENRSGWFDRVLHLRSKPYLVRELIAASTVMISQQLCGINVLIFYSASIFCERTTSNSLKPLFLSWGIGLLNVICALPAYRWIETMGRKWLLLATLPLLSAFIAAAAGSYAASDTEVQHALVATFAYMFTAVYSFGMGPVPFTYSAEVFPLEHRVIGMSLAVSVNFLGAGILAFFVPIFEIGIILLAVFAGLNICAFIATWKLVPETNGAAPRDVETHMTALDLSQLFYIFRRKNRIHRWYMSEVYFDYFWKTIWAILTFDKIPELEEPFLKYVPSERTAENDQP